MCYSLVTVQLICLLHVTDISSQYAASFIKCHFIFPARKKEAFSHQFMLPKLINNMEENQLDENAKPLLKNSYISHVSGCQALKMDNFSVFILNSLCFTVLQVK